MGNAKGRKNWKGEHTGDDGSVRMPARIPNARLPRPTTAVVVHIVRHRGSVQIRVSWAGVLRGVLDIDLPCERGVHVVDVNAPVFATRVDIPRIRAAWWGEMASDEGLQNAMPTVGD